MNQLTHKVLVVDDDQMNGKILSFLCGLYGFGVIQAFNGLEAFDLSKSELFDVILMDIDMPEMDGVQANKHIKQWYNNINHRCKYIGMSAAYQLSDAYIAGAGFDEFLQKPINTSELKTHLELFMRS
jgi:CheY-like chemotaxis protein